MKFTVTKIIAVCCFIAAMTSIGAAQKPAVNTAVPAKEAIKVEQAAALAIAKKYWLWASPIAEPALKDDFKKLITWIPAFDGVKKNEELAVKLSSDIMVLNTYNNAPNITAAIAGAAFDMAPGYVEPAQNLGCAIASFSDNNKDAKVRAREKEIYADAETLLNYAVYLSLDNGNYTDGSLDPLIALGNLYIDMKKYEEAKEKFETALKIREGYPPALTGMITYYKAVKKPQMIAGVKEAARKKPTIIGKAFNEIDKKQKPIDANNHDGTEASIEKYTQTIIDVGPVTYADIIEMIDPAAARQMKDRVKKLNDKMKITVPDISILTQYTTINEDNIIRVYAASQAVGQEMESIANYALRSGLQAVNSQADMLEDIGITAKVSVSGKAGASNMTIAEFIRDAAKNPQKYEDAEIEVDEEEMQRQAMAYAEQMMGGLSKATQGDPKKADPKAVTKVFKDSSKAEPILAILAVNPFEYANAWDIIIQQKNVRPLTAKMGALGAYINTVNSKALADLTDIRETLIREYGKLESEYNKKDMALSNADYSQEERQLKECQLKREYYPRFNNTSRIYWSQATQTTSMAYKKLENYIPKMYQSIMKHLVYITDEKIRGQQEDKLVGTIASGLQAAIGNVLLAYASLGKHAFDKTWIECDEEKMRQLTLAVAAQKSKAAAEMKAAQDKKLNAFKNGVIDENSSYYKKFIEPYESSVNLGVLKWKINDHFSYLKINLWTPNASLDYSRFENHLTGNTYINSDLSIRGGAGPVSGEATVGTTLVRDKNGNVHPDNIDERAGFNVGASKGFLSVSTGTTYSTQRGSRSYNKLELTGNEYLDGLKEEYFGDIGKWIPSEVPPKELWKGEYEK